MTAKSQERPNSSKVVDLKLYSRTMSLIVVALGCASLAGWALNINAMKTVFPGFPPMVPNTAVGFVLIGIAVWLQTADALPSVVRVFAISCATFVSFLAGLTLCEIGRASCRERV